MDVEYSLAVYLSNLGHGTIGTDIFIDQIPEDTNGIYITRSGGSLQKYLPVESALVDVYVKNTSAESGKGVCEQIKRQLHRMHNTSVASSYIYSILAVGDVTPIQRDLEYAKLYKISIEVMHRYTGLIS